MAAPAPLDMARLKANGPNWAKNASTTFGAGPCVCMCYCCKPVFNCVNGCLDSCCYTMNCCCASASACIHCKCSAICGLFKTCMADACGKCLPSCCKCSCCCGIPSAEELVRKAGCCSFKCLCSPCCNCIDSLCTSCKACAGACLKRSLCICCPSCIDQGCICYFPSTVCGAGCAIKGCCGCGPCAMGDSGNKYISDVAKAKAAGGAPQAVEIVGAPNVVATVGAPVTTEMVR